MKKIEKLLLIKTNINNMIVFVIGKLKSLTNFSHSVSNGNNWVY